MVVSEISLWPDTGLQYLESIAASQVEACLSVVFRGVCTTGEAESGPLLSVANSTATDPSTVSDTTSTAVSHPDIKCKEEKWKLRFSNFAELYKSVKAIMGDSSKSPVTLNGDLSALLKKLNFFLSDNGEETFVPPM
ncbi:hypothetical protein AGDE_16279 [Angomonas deanei]|uniref:Uncharacterized protein n=1 Tax=Angomonas deanei TaxID=59799 RepID=A0A7G2C6G1_9TRYP|nr:hypothetical protein AGDE_16279 [Angomonas deanei]CAD2213542.1 hypothetical protein, conserved [Angomonas deanei]|eukprot:EPY17386.1 hypothetical protein AGDE_16279 [Angomonas deanei]